MKSCFFIGHRDAPEALFPLLKSTVESHIAEYGVTEFIVGHYGNFDRLAAQAVISIKNKYPEKSLLLLLPYHPAERPISLPEGFDNTYYPPGMEAIPRRFAIIEANKHIIDHTDYLIAYAHYSASNSKKLLDYAIRRCHKSSLTVTNLSLQTFQHS